MLSLSFCNCAPPFLLFICVQSNDALIIGRAYSSALPLVSASLCCRVHCLSHAQPPEKEAETLGVSLQYPSEGWGERDHEQQGEALPLRGLLSGSRNLCISLSLIAFAPIIHPAKQEELSAWERDLGPGFIPPKSQASVELVTYFSGVLICREDWCDHDDL